jgi:hypothetical protein
VRFVGSSGMGHDHRLPDFYQGCGFSGGTAL